MDRQELIKVLEGQLLLLADPDSPRPERVGAICELARTIADLTDCKGKKELEEQLELLSKCDGYSISANKISSMCELVRTINGLP